MEKLIRNSVLNIELVKFTLLVADIDFSLVTYHPVSLQHATYTQTIYASNHT